MVDVVRILRRNDHRLKMLTDTNDLTEDYADLASP
jgi:hypothetical protein